MALLDIFKSTNNEQSMLSSILKSSLNAVHFIHQIQTKGFTLDSESPMGDIYRSNSGLLMLTVLPSHDPHNIYTLSYSPKDGDTITLVDECQLIEKFR